jgi:hypothetical protein
MVRTDLAVMSLELLNEGLLAFNDTFKPDAMGTFGLLVA